MNVSAVVEDLRRKPAPRHVRAQHEIRRQHRERHDNPYVGISSQPRCRNGIIPRHDSADTLALVAQTLLSVLLAFGVVVLWPPVALTFLSVLLAFGVVVLWPPVALTFLSVLLAFGVVVLWPPVALTFLSVPPKALQPTRAAQRQTI